MKIIDFPQLRQTYGYDCGAKALQTVLVYYGVNIREDQIIKDAKTDPEKGTPIKGIVNTAAKYGLKSVSGKMSIEDLKKYINKKIPVIVLLQAWSEEKNTDWENDWSNGHYVAAIGYTKDKILFEDPAAYERVYLKYDELDKRWHDVDTDGKKYFHHGIAIFGKKPVFKRARLIHMD